MSQGLQLSNIITNAPHSPSQNAGVLTPSSVAQIDYAIRNNGGEEPLNSLEPELPTYIIQLSKGLLGALGSLVNTVLGTGEIELAYQRFQDTG